MGADGAAADVVRAGGLVDRMSLLRDSDAPMHYSDGSHRWTAPEPGMDEAWRAQLEAHLEEHRRRPEEGYTPRSRPKGGPRRPERPGGAS